jgi:neutral ceramidase
MEAGFYEADITPSIGMERPATYYKIYVENINDPLKARALVLRDNARKIALVGVDICFLGEALVSRVREALPDFTVGLSASHTHYGGPMGMSPPMQDTPELIRKLIEEESVCENPDYTTHLVNQIVTSVKMAEKRLQAVQLSFGRGQAEGITFNRGFRMKDGHRATHPGKGNPDIVAPFAPIDTEVGVLGFWRESDSSFLGCLVNFSCHGTCDGTGASADWPGQMARTIKAVMGENSGVVYLYGTAGDITQIDNQSLAPVESGPAFSQILGVTVGAEALKVLMKAKKGAADTLQVCTSHLPLQRRAPSQQSLQEAQLIVQQWKRDAAFHFAKERLILAELIRQNPDFDLEMQVIQIGPLVIVMIPGELFSGIGLEIKQKSPFPFTWISSLANAAFGYIPTADAFDPETGGGYETRLTAFSCAPPDTAERIVSRALEMIRCLTPGTPPCGPQIQASRQVWAFSANAPELD